MSIPKINNTCCKLTVIPPHLPSITLKADTGASKNYIKPNEKYILSERKQISNGPQVKLPDGTAMSTLETGILPLDQFLSKTAKTGNVLQGLTNSSLLSIGQLCDDNCIAVFSKFKLNIYKQGQRVMTGVRNWTDGLWDVIVPAENCQNFNMIVRRDKTKHELAEYLHKCAFSPSLDTFQRAINKGHFLTWPGINEINFPKFVTNILPTAKGHLDQERANLQSTKKPHDNADENDYFPQDGIAKKTYENATLIFPMTPKLTTYSDQTGRFPHRSSRGNEYIMIMYDYDANAILCEPLKNRQAKTIMMAWTHLHQRLTKHGHETKNFILDNKCSGDLKSALQKNNKKYELTPPNMHRRNAAERAIRTFKNHCMAGFATCDKNFPLAEWDRLLVQAEITLNLLRTSRVNPTLSAYTYLFGNFDFNKTPLAPPGTKVLIHKKSNTRGSWDYHGVEGWYVGPSLEHYRCLKCYNPDTFSEVDTDTVKLIPNVTPIPVYTDIDVIKQAVADILSIIKNPAKNNIPTVLKGDAIQNAFKQISETLSTNKVRLLPLKKSSPSIAPTVDKNLSTNGNVPVTTPSSKIVKNINREPRVKDTTYDLPKPSVVLSSSDVRIHQPRSVKTLYPNPTIHTDPFQELLNRPLRVPTITVPRSPFTQFVPRPPVPRFRSSQPVQQSQWMAQHIFDDNGKKLNLDALLNGPNGDIWRKSISNELGRLSDGIPGRVRGTKAVKWIYKNQVPKNKKVTYANMVCDYRPLKEEKYRVRLTIGGDKLDYTRETASPTANLVDTKILINSTISDAHEGAKFMTADIKDCFLMTPLPEGDREYMRIHGKYFDNEFLTLHNLHDKINEDGYVYCEIQLGMYGLKQAAILYYNLIKQRLTPAGYYPIKESNGLWKHKTRKTTFALTIDDFGIKYYNKDDAEHLLNALRQHYDISVDWKRYELLWTYF